MLKVKAYSKVNLSLDVTGKRADGYHTLCSLMQSVSLCDTITVSVDKEYGSIKVNLDCSDGSICGEHNLAFMAAKRYLETAGVKACVNIYIVKSIPLAGGLGGGSVDAAAVLGVLNFIFDNQLSQNELGGLALSLGADVPFCLNGGTKLAEGVGEKLTDLSDLPECLMLIAKKGLKGSTGEMYRTLDSAESLKKSDLCVIKEGLRESNIKKASRGFYNCFETVCGKEALEIKEKMLQNGAFYAGLSGAGPSVVGIFETEDERTAAYNAVKSAGAEAFLCVPKKCGWEIVK